MPGYLIGVSQQDLHLTPLPHVCIYLVTHIEPSSVRNGGKHECRLHFASASKKQEAFSSDRTSLHATLPAATPSACIVGSHSRVCELKLPAQGLAEWPV